MIVLNLILMTAVAAGIVSLLGWAVLGDRRGKHTARGALATARASR